MTKNQKLAHELTMTHLSNFVKREKLLALICEDIFNVPEINEFDLYNATYQAALHIIEHLNPVE